MEAGSGLAGWPSRRRLTLEPINHDLSAGHLFLAQHSLRAIPLRGGHGKNLGGRSDVRPERAFRPLLA